MYDICLAYLLCMFCSVDDDLPKLSLYVFSNFYVHWM